MPENLTRLKDGRDWHGYLTLSSVDAVADRIRSMIGDGQPYTFVEVNEGFSSGPKIRISQVAEKITAKRYIPDEVARDMVHLQVIDDWSWGVYSTAADQDAAREQPEQDRVYLSFERDQLQIRQYVPAGYRVFWTVAVEDRMPREGDQVDAWIERKRDERGTGNAAWTALDGLLADYRTHAGYYIPMNKETPVEEQAGGDQ